MRKNKTKIHTYFLLAIFLLLVLPVSLPAQEEEEAKPVQLIPLKADFFTFFFKTFPSLFLKLLPIAAAAALIKILLLRRKLSIPWQWNPLEKPALAALAETMVEIFLLFLLVAFFAPAVSWLLTFIGIPFTAAIGSQTLRFIVHAVLALPFYSLIAGLIILIMVHLVHPLAKEEWRKYYKYGAFLALITPVLLVIFIFAGRFLLKWSYI